MRGATLPVVVVHQGHDISIHAPREGSDAPWGRGGQRKPISIHAPREGSDVWNRYTAVKKHDFYPRSP